MGLAESNGFRRNPTGSRFVLKPQIERFMQDSHIIGEDQLKTFSAGSAGLVPIGRLHRESLCRHRGVGQSRREVSASICTRPGEPASVKSKATT